MTCSGGYNAIAFDAIDTGVTGYYSSASGQLVAVVRHGNTPRTCEEGPSHFQEPSCSEIAAPCSLDAGDDTSDASVDVPEFQDNARGEAVAPADGSIDGPDSAVDAGASDS
jgi:hypothetical protein